MNETNGQSTRPPVLVAALRKYWWTLIPIFALSGFGAYQAAQAFGKESSVVQAALIYRGLPGAPGPTVYEPLSPKTCSELLTSVSVLRQVLDARSLEMPTSAFAELLTVNLTRNSSLIDVELAWGDPEDGIGLVNDLLDEFIRYVADERRETLKEHIKHVELALLQAKSEVDLARTKVTELRRRQQRQLIESGGYSEELYAGLLSSVNNTRFAIDDEQAEGIGIDQQMVQLGEKIEDLKDVLADSRAVAIEKLAAETVRWLDGRAAGYAKGSQASSHIEALVTKIEDLATNHDADSLQAWIAIAAGEINASPARPAESSYDSLAQAQAPVIAAHDEEASSLMLRIRDAERSLEGLQLRRFTVESKITVMKQRLDELETETEEIGEPLIGFDSSRLDDAEYALEDAEAHKQAMALQLATMRQLEKCRVNEWTVSVPAGPENTIVASNRTKVGALAFGLAAVGLFAPIAFGEWLGRRDPPEVAFARSVGLPVVANRVLPGPGSHGRGYRRLDDLDPDRIEKIRRFALRIQQSCYRNDRGATIVFSSLDQSGSATVLISALAECLSEREERVLLIDASPDDGGPSWVGVERPNDGSDDGEGSARPGLAEYLAAQCSDIAELAQPTGLPGVDAVYRGSAAFGREAMASSRLGRLVEESSHSYSMILVNGPAAAQSADLQMLAAHSDGVVFTTSGGSGTQTEAARAAVIEMLNLNAPIIGVVS